MTSSRGAAWLGFAIDETLDGDGPTGLRDGVPPPLAGGTSISGVGR